MEIVSHSLADTAALAARILGDLRARSLPKATVLALYGDLGSGKTTFTQFLAKELGITDYVTSPTFVIEKRYDISAPGEFKKMIHIDCYRLSSSAEMLQLDWTEITADPANLIVVEWPERIEDVLPEDCVRIQFEYKGENERRIKIENGNKSHGPNN